MPAENTKRIARNTAILYVRMLFTMVISLYTSRIVLNALGVDDFGINNAVGGVVSMFTLISGSLSAAVSRFLTFELGRNDPGQLKKVFSTALSIHILLAFIVLILTEGVGVWFLNTKMVIPPDRMGAANWVLQCSVAIFLINIISVPYNASVIAHERMKVFAYISVAEALLKLGVAFIIAASPSDRLIFYSLLSVAAAAVVRMIYGVYCKRNFPECNCGLEFDKEKFKEISGFAGWNFIGASSAVLRNQGVNILINIFCGPAVNAARGISMQVSNAVSGFANNFMSAVNPQITKSYACGDRNYMLSLVRHGARLSFYMLLFFSMPILLETHKILELWLKIVPDHTVLFVRLVLIFIMSESLSGTLITAMLATGRIKNYQLIVGGLQLMNFPVSYVFLKLGYFPEITMCIAIFFSQLCLAARLVLLRRMIGLSVRAFLEKVYANAVAVSLLSAAVPYLIYMEMEPGWARFASVLAVCTVWTAGVILYAGCSAEERRMIFRKLKEIRKKIFAHKL